MEFNELYQEIILDHYHNPRNKSDLEYISDEHLHENPACGDRIKVEVAVDSNEQVCSVKFDGSGCAICLASASMMSEILEGKSTRESEGIINTFLAVLRKEKDTALLENLGDLAVFKSLVRLPVRVKCASLSWNAALKMLRYKIVM